MRVTFRRLLNSGASNEADRIRHELRRLRNDIRAAIPSGAQVEFASVNATTSALDSRTALSWAATLPPRRLRITRAPAASARSSVESVDSSEVTTISRRSSG